MSGNPEQARRVENWRWLAEKALLDGEDCAAPLQSACDEIVALAAELAAATEALAIETQEREDFEASQAALLKERAEILRWGAWPAKKDLGAALDLLAFGSMESGLEIAEIIEARRKAAACGRANTETPA